MKNFPSIILRISILIIAFTTLPSQAKASLTAEAKESIQVTFICPVNPGNPFWDAVTSTMYHASDDLGIELKVLYGGKSLIPATAKAIRHIQAPDAPSYIVFPYLPHQGAQLLQAAEKEGIFSIIINTDLSEADRERIGRPRERYKYWLGHLYPNDTLASMELTQELLNQASTRFDRSREAGSIVALAGFWDSTVIADRLVGLRRAIPESSIFTLKQVVYGDWSQELASEQAGRLLQRYKDVRIFWAANGHIAHGAIEAVRKKGLVPGKDVLIGGFDWAAGEIKALRQGHLTASAGGNSLEGAWSLVLIYDYHHGLDFAKQGVTIKTKLKILTKANLETHRAYFSESQLKALDYRKFTKVHGHLDDYEFSLSD